MFDNYHHHASTSDTYVNVTEKRAPTDESVRLLRDMEDRAEKKVLAAVRVENTAVDMVLHKKEDLNTGDTLYACIFKINGKQMRADYRDRRNESRDVVIFGIRDAVANEIANLITKEAVQAMQKAFGKFDFAN